MTLVKTLGVIHHYTKVTLFQNGSLFLPPYGTTHKEDSILQLMGKGKGKGSGREREMGSFLDVVWVVSSVRKCIRGVSYPANIGIANQADRVVSGNVFTVK